MFEITDTVHQEVVSKCTSTATINVQLKLMLLH